MRTLALIFALLGDPLWAQSDLRPEDAARLDRFTPAAGGALLQALSGGAPSDVAELAKALSGTAQIAFDESLIGDWKCRTMKLGGTTNLTVYTNFKCRFSIGPTGFDFEKLTGSQRTKGTIQLRNGRAVYVGVGYTAGENAPDYADLPDIFQSDSKVHTQVAIFERISQTRARLMFPAPAVQTDFEILELTR